VHYLTVAGVFIETRLRSDELEFIERFRTEILLPFMSNLENSMKKKAKSGAKGAQMTSKSLKL
jgi:hypothetical protein